MFFAVFLQFTIFSVANYTFSQATRTIKALFKQTFFSCFPKGDFLETTCLYNTEHKQNATIGGHAITDEMCVNYMHYYPATELEVCKSAISNMALENYFKFEKRYDLKVLLYTVPFFTYGERQITNRKLFKM